MAKITTWSQQLQSKFRVLTSLFVLLNNTKDIHSMHLHFPFTSMLSGPFLCQFAHVDKSLLLIYIHLGISWLLTNCFLSGTCNFVIHLFITFIFLFPIINFFLFFTKILSLIFLDSYSHFQNIF